MKLESLSNGKLVTLLDLVATLANHHPRAIRTLCTHRDPLSLPEPIWKCSSTAKGFKACTFGDGCQEKHTRQNYFFLKDVNASFSQEWTSHPFFKCNLDSYILQFIWLFSKKQLLRIIYGTTHFSNDDILVQGQFF